MKGADNCPEGYNGKAVPDYRKALIKSGRKSKAMKGVMSRNEK